jgi:hypothetical protein
MAITADNVPSNARAKARAKSPWFDSRRLKLLAFYLGIPVAVGIYGAINNWQLLREAGYFQGIAFYLAHAIPPWTITCAMTTLVMYLLRQWKPSPYVIIGIGSVAAAFVVTPGLNWITIYYENRFELDELHDQVAPMFSVGFWRYLISATALWYLANFVFDRFLGLPRYRYAIPRGYDYKNPPGVQPPPAEAMRPNFLERAPVQLGVADVLAIKAEQHYIRVISAEREYMLLYRFSDAMNELDPATGQQVHRSFWVNNAAIDTVRPRAKRFTLKLSNGFEVPVSSPYHAVVKDFARQNGLRIIG